MLKSIAIIIPAYNAAKWIGEAIASALAQTHPPSAIIVIDDGSTDDTAAAALRVGNGVQVLSQPNEGVSVARNRGANQVSADGLLFLDADDRLRATALEQLSARARQGDVGTTYGETLSFGEAARQRAAQASCQGEPPLPALANFWKAVPASPGAVLIRSEHFHNCGGFDPALSTAADRALWLRLGAEVAWGHVDSIVLERREHAASMVRNRGRARLEGAQAQLGFLDWCRVARPELHPEFPTDAEVIHRNILRGLEEREYTAVQWLSDEALRRKIVHPSLDLARRLLAMPAVLREAELKVRGWLKV